MKGFTLVEIVVILVVISIAAVALFSIFSRSVARSADPMLRVQAVAIAQNYLEEALLKAYQDPGGGVIGCEAERQLYDDVLDYNCFIDTNGARDQFNNPLVGLEAYNVDVNVMAGDIEGLVTRRVEVIVTHDNTPSLRITLVGHKVNY